MQTIRATSEQALIDFSGTNTNRYWEKINECKKDKCVVTTYARTLNDKQELVTICDYGSWNFNKKELWEVIGK